MVQICFHILNSVSNEEKNWHRGSPNLYRQEIGGACCKQDVFGPYGHRCQAPSCPVGEGLAHQGLGREGGGLCQPHLKVRKRQAATAADSASQVGFRTA